MKETPLIPTFVRSIWRSIDTRGYRYNVSVKLYSNDRYFFTFCNRSWRVLKGGASDTLEDVQSAYDEFLKGMVALKGETYYKKAR